MRFLFLLAVLILAALANVGLWYLPNQPVELPPPPGGKLASVSFAPFRDGQSPLTLTYPTPAQIEEDMKVIAGQVAGIRTYTSTEGLEVVPELARKYGLTVSMGAWLSAKPEINEREVAAVIDLANRYPDVIKRVIVGNEVMLRQELKPEQLIAYIDRVKAAVKQPVAYADVWEFWLKYPEIAPHVDVVTIHLLPYWEDEPTSVAGAMSRIEHAYDTIAARFPGKTIMVGETGWPTAGRNRSAARVGLVEKAQFVSAFVDLAHRRHFDYNVIEAFDQAWKQKLEGTVGGHWGIADSNRHPKFTLGQPVVANPDWLKLSIAAGLIAGFSVLVLAAFRGIDSPRKVLPLVLLAFALADGLVFGAHRLFTWKAYPLDLAFGSAVLALEAVLALAALAAAQTLLRVRVLESESDLGLAERLDDFSSLDRIGPIVAALLAVVAAVWALLLIFDGRYRDFPNHHMIVPLVALLALGWIRATKADATDGAWSIGFLFRPALPVGDTPAGLGYPGTGAGKRLERWIGRVLLWSVPLTVIAEGFAPVESLLGGQLPLAKALHEVDWFHPNIEALAWAAMLWGLSIPFRAAGRLR